MYYYYYHYYNQFPYNTDFSERLRLVLNGRKIYPWATILGASRGAAETMKKGNIPGPDILNAIHHREHVSLSWLVSGDGPAFRIYHYACDQSFSECIDEVNQSNTIGKAQKAGASYPISTLPG